jgi:hypothetical protein
MIISSLKRDRENSVNMLLETFQTVPEHFMSDYDLRKITNGQKLS